MAREVSRETVSSRTVINISDIIVSYSPTPIPLLILKVVFLENILNTCCLVTRCLIPLNYDH